MPSLCAGYQPPSRGSIVEGQPLKPLYGRLSDHSSFCSSILAPTRQVMAASSGEMPRTFVPRLISALTLSSGLVL